MGITNRLAKEFGYKTVNATEVRQLQNLSSQEIIKQSGISFVQLPFLLHRVKGELSRQIHQLQPIAGIPEALIDLYQSGNRLGIVTSNAEVNVRAFLRQHKLQNLFEFVYSSNTLFGKHKVLKRLLTEKQFHPDSVIYVGDETRDIEAAKRVRIQAIAVSWGFNSKQALARHDPDFLISDPAELLPTVQSLEPVGLS